MKSYNFLPARKSFELLERHIDKGIIDIMVEKKLY